MPRKKVAVNEMYSTLVYEMRNQLGENSTLKMNNEITNTDTQLML